MVRIYKGVAKSENLVETKATATEGDEEALEAIRKRRTQPPNHPRITEPPPFNPGLLFLPRP